MTALHRTEAFLRCYAFLPHRVLNRATALLTSAQRPAWAVDRAIDHWAQRDGIDRSEFEQRRFASLDDFFLRRLAPGARPLEPGFVAPCDGNLIAAGRIDLDRPLVVKQQRLSVDRVVNGGVHDLGLSDFEGGTYAVIFLTPRGYHRVHMPVAGTLEAVRWIPGRYFPQNEDALRVVPRVYERNERATLSCRDARGRPFLMVMVGASLIGGIHLDGVDRRAWVKTEPHPIGRALGRGDELGHFAFGSTVVVLLPRGYATGVVEQPEVRMGQRLLDCDGT
ncbi:MAG: phosphatidylserine decarboxylase [Polyangiaceae bacterium]|nr:phosphatidylserine decarboxylase [Polyangiaceae bacterium]